MKHIWQWLLRLIQGRKPAPPAAPAPTPAPGVMGRPIPPEYFGMHMIASGAKPWPTVPFGRYRAHDATPRWHHFPAGQERLDAVLEHKEAYAPNAEVVYVIGGGGDDTRGGIPAHLDGASDDYIRTAWRFHVRALAKRYKGRIRYWEIWNEFNSGAWYHRDSEFMVQLVRIASEELRAADPTNVILSPSITEGGHMALDRFLMLGGAKYVDVIAWHQNLPYPPEQAMDAVKKIRDIMTKYGVDKPLWTTEGHGASNGENDAEALMRYLMTLWLAGVECFCWYAWDITSYAPDPGQWITLWDGQTTPAGEMYRSLYHRLVGSRVDRLQVDKNGWTVYLTRADGSPDMISWLT